jgi:hypothetical protein
MQADFKMETLPPGQESPKEIPTERAAATVSESGSTVRSLLTALAIGTPPTW